MQFQFLSWLDLSHHFTLPVLQAGQIGYQVPVRVFQRFHVRIGLVPHKVGTQHEWEVDQKMLFQWGYSWKTSTRLSVPVWQAQPSSQLAKVNMSHEEGFTHILPHDKT